MESKIAVRALSREATPSEIVYTFGSLVTDLDEYRAMVAAFQAAGFGSDCEFVYADNSGSNDFDAFSAYNRFLLEARGRYVVLCHQDVLPLTDGRAVLDERLAELTRRDARWALCGNAGGKHDGNLVFRLTHGPDRDELDYGGPFPLQVMSLDENFIVVRRDANLALSSDLVGFHWYGADLCIVADILGWNAYVIDFRLFHKSTGNVGTDFREKAHAFRRKWGRAFRARWQYVPTSQPEFLSGSPTRTFLARAAHRLRRQFSGRRSHLAGRTPRR